MLITGVVFAILAMIAWGVGDFLIQRTTRVLGDWKALFYIGLAGTIVLFPFVIDELPTVLGADIVVLGLLALVMIIAPLVDFEALKQGKMAVIEPIIGMELPLTVLFAVIVAGEVLTPFQFLLVASVFIGMLLVVTTRLDHLQYHRRLLEKGTWLALTAALGMAASNFLIGESSQLFSPLLAVWVISVARVVVCGIFLTIRGELSHLVSNAAKHPLTVAGQSILDNAAWLAFAFATTLIPIAIATTISGGYVAVAVLLGLFVTRERVRAHQLIGIVLVSFGILVLSYLYG